MTSYGPAAVYLLCLFASAACGALLVRAYFRASSRLLLWTAISFACLALNNLLLVADMLVLDRIDLWAPRQLSAMAAIAVLLYGFIWESE